MLRTSILAKLLFFGNCQLGAVASAARMCPGENEVVYISNYEAIDIESKVIHGSLEHAIKTSDIIIYQPMGAKWGAYAFLSHYLDELGKPSVVLPYIYIDGFWPAYRSGNKLVGIPNGLLQYAQRATFSSLHTFEDCYKVIRDLEKLANDTDIFGLNGRLFLGIKTLEHVEKRHRTIPVSSYILGHFRNHRVMLTQNHPTALLTTYCLYKSLSILHNLNRIDRSFVQGAKDLYLSASNINPATFIGSPYPMSSHVAQVFRMSYPIPDDESEASRVLTSQIFYATIRQLGIGHQWEVV
jgi:hypothetical protein